MLSTNLLLLLGLILQSNNQGIMLMESLSYSQITNPINFKLSDYSSPQSFSASFWIKVVPITGALIFSFTKIVKIIDNTALSFFVSIQTVSFTSYILNLRSKTFAITASSITTDMTTCFGEDPNWAFISITYHMAGNNLRNVGRWDYQNKDAPIIATSPGNFNNFYLTFGIFGNEIRSDLHIYLALVNLYFRSDILLFSFPNTYLLFGIIYNKMLAIYEPMFFPYESQVQDQLHYAPPAVIYTDSSGNWNATSRVHPQQNAKLLFDTDKKLLIFDKSLFILNPVHNSYTFILSFRVWAESLLVDNIKTGNQISTPTVTFLLYRRKSVSDSILLSNEFEVSTTTLNSALKIFAFDNILQTYIIPNINLLGVIGRVQFTNLNLISSTVISSLFDYDCKYRVTYLSPYNTELWTGFFRTLAATDSHFIGNTVSFVDPLVSLEIITATFTIDFDCFGDNGPNFICNSFNALFRSYSGNDYPVTYVDNNDFKNIKMNAPRKYLVGSFSFCQSLANCDLCYSGLCYRCWFNFYLQAGVCVFCQIENGFVYDYISQTCYSALISYNDFKFAQQVFNLLVVNSTLVFSIACKVVRKFNANSFETFYFHGNNLTFSSMNSFNLSTEYLSQQVADEVYRIQLWFIMYFRAVVLPFYKDSNCIFNFARVQSNNYANIYSENQYLSWYMPEPFSTTTSGQIFQIKIQNSTECPSGIAYDSLNYICTGLSVQTTSNNFTFTPPVWTLVSNTTTNVTKNTTINTTTNITNETNTNAPQSPFFVHENLRNLYTLIQSIVSPFSLEQNGDIFTQTPIIEKNCPWTTFKYEGECLKCIVDCVVCIDPISCLICNANTQLNQTSGKCVNRTSVIENPYANYSSQNPCATCVQSKFLVIDYCQNCFTVCACNWQRLGMGEYIVNCPQIDFDLAEVTAYMEREAKVLPMGNSSSFYANASYNQSYLFFHIQMPMIISTSECVIPLETLILRKQLKFTAPVVSSETSSQLQTAVAAVSTVTNLNIVLATHVAPLIAVNKFFRFLQLTRVKGGMLFLQINGLFYNDDNIPFKSIVNQDDFYAWWTYVSITGLGIVFNDFDMYLFCGVIFVFAIASLVFFELRRVNMNNPRYNTYNDLFEFCCKFRMSYATSSGSFLILCLYPLFRIIQFGNVSFRVIGVLVTFVLGYCNVIWSYFKYAEFIRFKNHKKFGYLRQFTSPSLIHQETCGYFISLATGSMFTLKCLVLFFLSGMGSTPFYSCLFLQVTELTIAVKVLRINFRLLMWLKINEVFWEFGFTVLMLLNHYDLSVPDLILNVFYVGGNASQLIEAIVRFVYLTYQNRIYARRKSMIQPINRNRSQQIIRGNSRVLNRRTLRESSEIPIKF